MNLSVLTPQMWEVIRKWDYNTLMAASRMMQPLDDEDDL